MTVVEAFQIFKSNLELPDRKQQLAASKQREFRLRISAYLPVVDSKLTGSYSRHTKIDPLVDIDVFLIMNAERVTLSYDGNGVSASEALDQVVKAVQRAYPLTATIKKQSRSVNVQLAGLGFGFDAIPAWLRDPNGYWIPDSDSGNWIPTNPDAHANLMTAENERCGGKLKPLIKMVKHWSRNNYDLVRSFHLELILAGIFGRQELTTFPIGVATALVHLPPYIGQELQDPIYGSSRVDKPLSGDEQSKLLARINYDAQNSLEAVHLEANGRHFEAIEKWKHIFTSGFPS